MLASAHAQDSVAEAPADGADLLLVVQTRFLEGGEGVGAEDLRPLVAVVAGCVPSREDVAEAAQEAILRKRLHHGVARRDLLLQVERGRPAFRVKVRVERHVQLAEVQLPEHSAARHEMPGVADLLEQLLRQRLARLVVHRDAQRGLLVVAPVLHKLRRQLDRVPLDVVDSRGASVVHLGQHVLQPVAELVEERLHLPEGHEAGLVADRRRAVAREVRNRLARQHLRLAHADVHPRAAALLRRPRERIQEERRDLLARLAVLDHVVGHVRVPHLDILLRLFNGHVEEALREAEEAVQDVGQREVRTQLFLRVAVQLLAEALGVEGHIPELQFALKAVLLLRELLQVLQLLHGGGVGLLAEHLAELRHRLDGGGHLAIQAHRRVVGLVEHFRHLLADLQDAEDVVLVVHVPACRARHVRAVELLAELAVLEVLHRRQVAGDVQRDGVGPRLRARVLGRVLAGSQR
eukprot:scaffold13_cov241-Pinguiococcus_pyrenoidosus.AAC.32